LDAAYHRFTDLADRKKRIYDQDLLSLLVTDATMPTAATTAAENQWPQIVAA
jgi:2-isopropylmalate synthase